MASKESGQERPLEVVPINSVPPNPAPAEEFSSSNPKIASSSQNPMPVPLPPSEFFKNKDRFPHANTPSTVTEVELRNIRARYQIPNTHRVRVPGGNERMYQRPVGWTAMPVTLLEKGVRFPLHTFSVTLLGFVGIGFAQLFPNSYINILAFIAICHELDVPPAVDLFFTLFSAGKSREPGFKLLSKQAPKPNSKIEKRPLMDTPSSNRGWHNKWFYVKGPEISSLPDWTISDRASNEESLAIQPQT